MLRMARRGKSSIKPLWIIVAVILLVIAFVGSSLFFTGGSEAYRTVPALPVQAYLDNANSLRSNVYKLRGEISNSLAFSPTGGRLFAVSVDEGRSVVPILVTTKFNHVNIQKGQHFIFLLEVDEKGILRTKDLTKA